MHTAAVLIIGNEILSGKIQEANLIELARLLRELGIRLKRVVVEADDVPTIAAEIASLSSTYDYVFTSGGVGPTHDDVTMQGVASAFGVDVTVHPVLEEMLRKYYGAELSEGQRRLALVPRGAQLVSTPDVPWPVTVMRNVWILPGIPEVFRMKLPILRKHLAGGEPFLTRAVFTQLDESDLHPILERIVRDHPRVEVGSYPAWSHPRYRTKLTFDGKEREAIEQAMAEFLRLLPEGEPQWIE